MSEESKIVTAAYVPFKTFQSALEHLKTHGVPNIIDRSVFRSQSGNTQTQIIGALTFLGLIDERGVPTETLHKLVDETENRKANLKALLEEKYSNLFKADLMRVTPSQFDSLFSPDIYGASGDTRKKARAFLFFALDYTGVPYSKLLTQRTRAPKKKGTTGTTINNNDVPKDNSNGDTPQPPKKDDVIHGQAIKAIELVDSKKTVWIGTDANMFEIKRGKDLEFVLKLIELFDEYESKNKAKEPTEETFVAEAED